MSKQQNEMTVKNTINTEKISKVAATMAVENMSLNSGFVKELIKVANGERTSEELRQEVIAKFAR